MARFLALAADGSSHYTPPFMVTADLNGVLGGARAELARLVPELGAPTPGR